MHDSGICATIKIGSVTRSVCTFQDLLPLLPGVSIAAYAAPDWKMWGTAGIALDDPVDLDEPLLCGEVVAGRFVPGQFFIPAGGFFSLVVPSFVPSLCDLLNCSSLYLVLCSFLFLICILLFRVCEEEEEDDLCPW